MNRLRHKKRWKNFAARTGDPFSRFCDDKGIRPEEAEDITQGFFAELLERRSLERGPQGKGTTSFLSAWGTEIFSGQRAASGDGDQARERTAAYSVGRTAR